MEEYPEEMHIPVFTYLLCLGNLIYFTNIIYSYYRINFIIVWKK